MFDRIKKNKKNTMSLLDNGFASYIEYVDYLDSLISTNKEYKNQINQANQMNKTKGISYEDSIRILQEKMENLTDLLYSASQPSNVNLNNSTEKTYTFEEMISAWKTDSSLIFISTETKSIFLIHENIICYGNYDKFIQNKEKEPTPFFPEILTFMIDDTYELFQNDINHNMIDLRISHI